MYVYIYIYIYIMHIYIYMYLYVYVYISGFNTHATVGVFAFLLNVPCAPT